MPSKTKLGVLTLYLGGKKGVFEERSFFRQLTVAGQKIGVDVYIFTPENVDEGKQRIHAHQFSNGKWARVTIPYPELFLDRSRFYSTAQFRTITGFRQRNPQLTFISTPLQNKWKLYTKLAQQPAIRPYLPHTMLYRGFDDLRKQLLTNRLIYLKPINGSGGRGILRIERISDGVYSFRGRMASRRIIPERRVNLLQLRSLVNERQPANRYIVQQGIDIRLRSGHVHDYRMLIQKNGQGEWEVTGCVGRVGPAGSVTSNLHGGGRAVPMLKLLTHWFGNETKAKSVTANVHKFGYTLVDTLESLYGRLCELALDLAIDKTGHIWLLEVNTKPARQVFARIGDRTAYHKAISRPLEYAKWLSRTKSGDGS